MIRNVVTGRLKPGADLDRVREGLAGIEALRLEGLVRAHARLDAGLRDGNGDYGIVVDLVDAAAYHRYDSDPEHERIRSQLIGPEAEQVLRVQIEVED
ncbi:Dabb family protein [Kineococcus terrestris]|uniref:Dabb family protein n=1 Tax=Kineococcus terrestris TaxID=2044856 RepID=UPI0034DB739B